MAKNEGFLTKEGKAIFERIKTHCVQNNILFEIDDLELAMLCNSFDMYAVNAELCNKEGIAMTIITEKGGTYSQIRPEYTVMKNEYQNILKHSSKFGLNPGDRAKIFSGMKQEKKKGFNLKAK
jgi:P27 family predicted phage terminase small subunit